MKPDEPFPRKAHVCRYLVLHTHPWRSGPLWILGMLYKIKSLCDSVRDFPRVPRGLGKKRSRNLLCH